MPEFSGCAVQTPMLFVDRSRVLRNIQRMAEKARRSRVDFRPHFKTHQSREIGRWFRDFSVEKITVSSLDMAAYFARDGWKDITVAFPVNLCEAGKINALAEHVRLHLLADNPESITALHRKLRAPVGIFLKVDTGYHRAGIPAEEPAAFEPLLARIERSPNLQFRGFLTHAGHTYAAGRSEKIAAIYRETAEKMQRLKEAFLPRYPELILSVGDTPGCSAADDLSGVDEVRPGNFVFYDLTQLRLGVCKDEDLAVALACPVVGKYRGRREAVVYGGAVHFSKERDVWRDGRVHFGFPAEWAGKGWSAPRPAAS